MHSKAKFIKIFVLSFGVGAIIVAASFLTFSLIKNQLKEQLLQKYAAQEQLVGNEVAGTLQTSVASIQDSLEIMAQSPAVQSPNQSICAPVMAKYYQLLHVSVDNLTRVNTNGIFYCSVNSKLDTIAASKLTPDVAQLFADPQHKAVISNLIKTAPISSEPLVALNVPVYNQQQQFVGSLGAAIYMHDLAANYLSKIKFANTGYASLLDDNGDILYSHISANIGKNFFSPSIQAKFSNGNLNESIRAAVQGRSSIVEYTRLSVRKIASVQPINILPGHRWVVVVTVPDSEVESLFLNPLINKSFNVALIVLAVAVGLVVIVLLTSSIRMLELQKAKDQFISLTSHQLRTPLTAIRLFSEMLADKRVGSLNEVQKDYVDKIQSSTQRMIMLVGDILNTSRIELKRIQVKPQPTDLNTFLTEHGDELQPLADEKHVKLVLHLPAKHPTVAVDRVLLSQIVHNLLTNAVRYTNPDSGSVELRLNTKGDYYLISVKDNGIGIPPKAHKKIFSQFYRAENAKRMIGEGTGLGLYLVKSLADITGCKLWFKSIEGSGTTFYVTIPVKGMQPKNGDKTIV